MFFQKNKLMRLTETRREFLHAKEQLLQKAKLIEEARQQRDTAHTLVRALLDTLPELSREDQEGLIMALIARVDVSGDNQVESTLRLAPDVIHDLPILFS